MTYLLVALIYITVNSILSFAAVRVEARTSRSKKGPTVSVEQIEETVGDPWRTGA
jgi:hypothetical protein